MVPRSGDATALGRRRHLPGWLPSTHAFTNTAAARSRAARRAQKCCKRMLSTEVHGPWKPHTSPFSYSQPAMAVCGQADMVKPWRLFQTSARDELLLQRRALGMAALGMMDGPVKDTVKSTTGSCHAGVGKGKGCSA